MKHIKTFLFIACFCSCKNKNQHTEFVLEKEFQDSVAKYSLTFDKVDTFDLRFLNLYYGTYVFLFPTKGATTIERGPLFVNKLNSSIYNIYCGVEKIYIGNQITQHNNLKQVEDTGFINEAPPVIFYIRDNKIKKIDNYDIWTFFREVVVDTSQFVVPDK